MPIDPTFLELLWFHGQPLMIVFAAVVAAWALAEAFTR